MINTFEFDSVIEKNGVIVLPDHMKSLHRHRVRLIVIDLETPKPDPVSLLTKITQRYLDIEDEAELPVEDIYRYREQNHERLNIPRISDMLDQLKKIRRKGNTDNDFSSRQHKDARRRSFGNQPSAFQGRHENRGGDFQEGEKKRYWKINLE